MWPFCKCCSINLLMKVTLMWWASLVTTNWVLGGLAEVIHGWVRILAADGLLEGSTSNIWRTRSWEQKKCESEVIIYDEISKVRFKKRKCHVTNIVHSTWFQISIFKGTTCPVREIVRVRNYYVKNTLPWKIWANKKLDSFLQSMPISYSFFLQFSTNLTNV